MIYHQYVDLYKTENDRQYYNNQVVYSFITHSDGSNTAKSPLGCFDEDKVPNDLAYVISKIEEYNN